MSEKKGVFRLVLESVSYLKNNGIKDTLLRILFVLNGRASLPFTSADEGDYVPYDSKYQENENFSGKTTDVKALAFYLPQFHEFKENNEWWGKGFTEWVNTEKAEPRFKGHYQPRRPHKDIGFYDLSSIETMKKQVELAKMHGLYGFCFYYYWFSGKRLMEKPVDLLLEHPEIDMPFCLCWANENWTRTWSGNQKDVLIAQEYSDDDREKFIDDLKKYIDDKRYIRINGKPVIVVYNAGELPNKKETFNAWRKRAVDIGIGEILIWVCRTCNHDAKEMQIEDYIDAEVEFPPHNFWGFKETWIRNLDLSGKSANIYNYQKLVDIIQNSLFASKDKLPVYRTAFMGWDNACRRANNWTTFYAYSLKSFYKWVSLLVTDARLKFKKEEERFIFVNAWNEWAEGTYLEPDEKYGYANINTFSKAVFDIPFESRITLTDRVECKDLESLSNEPKIAVQAHIFYTDTAEEIAENVSCIPYPFDLYVTTDTSEKKKELYSIFERKSGAKNIFIDIVPNRGRDVAPFLMQIRKVSENYKYICHIHSKKTGTSEYGTFWRKYLYRNLFGCTKHLNAIFNLFESDKTIGLVYPESYPLLWGQEQWGGNKSGVEAVCKMLGVDAELPHDIHFPVGNMFWMRTEAVKKMLNFEWTLGDFPKEAGQVNLTIGHQIERIWNILVESEGYRVEHVLNTFHNDELNEKKAFKRIAIYAHYDADSKVTKSDVLYCKELRKFCEKIVFVSNNKDLNGKELLSGVADVIYTRENEGYDFGAWKYGMIQTGFKELAAYDELVCANNSCYAPLYGFYDIFCKMSGKKDLWGLSEFPYLPDGSFIGKKYINQHVQSYFMVFGKKLLNDNCFEKWWTNIGCYNKMEEVVAYCESEMTSYFESRGFSKGAYIEESLIMPNYMACYSVPFEHPYAMFLMGNPLLKKKSMNTKCTVEKNICLNLLRNVQ